MLSRYLHGLLLFVAVVFVCVMSSNASVAGADKDAFTRPQVVVLVLGGIGPSDMCSINYDSIVALPKAQADLDAIASAGKWQVHNARGETKSSGGPRPVQSTSISFDAKGLIDSANGTLPLEPFLIGLKRFKFIEVQYMTPSGFAFRGLKDFENKFVKVQMSQRANTYAYRIVVKDAGFEKLGIPLREPEKPQTTQGQPSAAGRVFTAIGLAVLAAILVYFVTMYISKRR